MDWVELKLFISSTFRDMYYEREELVKNVLWRLKNWCEKRKIILSEIDLRWGVTEYMAKTQKITIEKCLDGVDKSRIFLCFLGDYRGWMPRKGEIAPKTYEKYSALEAIIGKKSATEIEIDHAINKKTTQKHELVFFKRKIENEIPKHLKIVYTNAEIKDEKERIKADLAVKELSEIYLPGKGYIPIPYSAHFTENNSLRFGENKLSEKLFNELSAKILSIYYPERKEELHPDTPIKQEQEHQERLLYMATRAFVDCGDIKAIKKRWEKTDRSLIIYGEAGCGRSSTFAHLITDLKKTSFIKYHFANNSDSLTDILLNFLEEITGASEIENLTFQKVLGRLAPICSNKNMIIAIDGMEHFPKLQLTEMFSHSGIRIIGTMRYDCSIGVDLIDEWAGYRPDQIETYQVKSFDNPSYRNKLVKKYLENYLKTLNKSQMSLLQKKPGANNPLFLKIILSEIRIFGSYEKLSDMLEIYGNDIVSAFSAMLGRLENDYETIGLGCDTIQDVFVALTTASNWLTVPELAAVSNADEEQLQMLFWQIEPFIDRIEIDKEPAYSLKYDSLRSAVKNKYHDRLSTMHNVLYKWFLNCANPDGYFSGKLRALENLFHHAKVLKRHILLATNLKYLDARIRSGGLKKLIHDISMAIFQENADKTLIDFEKATLYRNFLYAHISNLLSHPKSLLSLMLLEGEELKTYADSEKSDWHYPFIDFEKISLPLLPQKNPNENALSVKEEIKFEKVNALDMSIDEGFIFCWERNGEIAVYDSTNPEEETTVIQIKKGRVEAIFISNDIDYLAVAYETGVVIVYYLKFTKRKLLGYDMIYQTNYLLPEDSPVFYWEQNKLLFQSETGEFTIVEFNERKTILEKSLRMLDGEITAIGGYNTVAIIQNNGKAILYSYNTVKEFDYKITCLCKSENKIAVATANRLIGIYDLQTLSETTFIEQSLFAKTMVYHDSSLYIACRGMEANRNGKLYVYNADGKLSELSQNILPGNLLCTFIKIGFRPDGQLVSLNNFSFRTFSFDQSLAIKSTISHVFSCGKDLFVLRKQSDNIYLSSIEKIKSQMSIENLNINWYGSKKSAIGITRIGNKPFFCVTENDILLYECPEVITAGADNGWMLGESGYIYHFDADTETTVRIKLTEPNIKLNTISVYGKRLFVEGQDFNDVYVRQCIFVYEIIENGLRFLREYSFPSNKGHYQNFIVKGDELCVFFSDMDMSFYLLAYNLQHIDSHHPIRIHLPFLKSYPRVAYDNDIFYILDTAKTLFAFQQSGELLCSIYGITSIDSVYHCDENLYISSGEKLWKLKTI